MSRSSVVRGAGLITGALLAFTGCTSGHIDTGAVSPTGASSSTTSTAPTGFVSLQTVQTFRIGKRQVDDMAVTDKSVFVSASSLNGGGEQLLRLNLSTGKQTVVTTSTWQTGLIQSVAASGDWVTWVDQSSAESTGGGPVTTLLWRVWAKNVKTGRTILLDTSGSTSSFWVPGLATGDGYIAWASYGTGTTQLRQMLWQVGRPQARIMPVNLSAGRFQHSGGAKAIADGKLIFLVPADTKLGRNYGVGNCWSSPIEGGKAHRLSDTGLAQWCLASGTDLVWTEHIDPATHDKAAIRSAGSDPFELKALSLTAGAKPRTIHEGSMGGGFPLVGYDFVVWFADGTHLSSLSSSATTTVTAGGGAWKGAAGGDLFAYPHMGKKTTTVTVSRVLVTGP